MTKTTIKDIAHELGISGSTVSRALHDDARISKEVIAEVKNAATRMGYVANISATSLRTGRSRLIGLIVRDIRDGFCLEVIPSVEAACAESGYGLLLCNVGGDMQHEREYFYTLLRRRVDGIIVITPTTHSPHPYLLYHREVPIVLVDTIISGNPLCAVSVDHHKGGYLSTRHLLDQGHRSIACVAGPVTISGNLRGVEGYQHAMEDAGIPQREQLVILEEGTSIEHGYQGLIDILKFNPRPTAVAAFSDLMAAGILEAARQFRLEIPRDLSVAGYDDIPLSSLLTPPLTTIKQNKDELGSTAVRLLLEEIHGLDHQHRQIMVQPELIVRGSTSAPGKPCP